MKRFSDFAEPDGHFVGKKINIKEVLDQEIEILNFNVRKSKKNDGDLLTIQLRYNDQLHVIFTGSNVLITQLSKYQSELPFITIIKQLGACYSLT